MTLPSNAGNSGITMKTLKVSPLLERINQSYMSVVYMLFTLSWFVIFPELFCNTGVIPACKVNSNKPLFDLIINIKHNAFNTAFKNALIIHKENTKEIQF